MSRSAELARPSPGLVLDSEVGLSLLANLWLQPVTGRPMCTRFEGDSEEEGVDGNASALAARFCGEFEEPFWGEFEESDHIALGSSKRARAAARRHEPITWATVNSAVAERRGSAGA